MCRDRGGHWISQGTENRRDQGGERDKREEYKMLCYRDGLEPDPLVAPACLLVSVLIDFGEVRQQA